MSPPFDYWFLFVVGSFVFAVTRDSWAAVLGGDAREVALGDLERRDPLRPDRSGDRSEELLLPGVASACARGDLLPTPRASDTNGVGEHGTGGLDLRTAVKTLTTSRWGRYAVAVARCEALTRPAPDPTLPSGKGDAHRLSPLFVEFLMMLPTGWVTDPALWTHLSASAARNVQLKLLGNGCVTAQAAAAWRHLTSGLVTTMQVTAMGA